MTINSAFFIRLERSKFQKHGCQNLVAMELSSHVNIEMSSETVAQQIFITFTKFGAVCFQNSKGINVQSPRENFATPLPPLKLNGF